MLFGELHAGARQTNFFKSVHYRGSGLSKKLGKVTRAHADFLSDLFPC